MYYEKSLTPAEKKNMRKIILTKPLNFQDLRLFDRIEIHQKMTYGDKSYEEVKLDCWYDWDSGALCVFPLTKTSSIPEWRNYLLCYGNPRSWYETKRGQADLYWNNERGMYKNIGLNAINRAIENRCIDHPEIKNKGVLEFDNFKASVTVKSKAIAYVSEENDFLSIEGRKTQPKKQHKKSSIPKLNVRKMF